MTITLVVAPSASGKTEYCLERARRVLEERPLQGVWYLVPDRIQAAATRRRCARVGGAMALRVGTFGDLYQYLMLRGGRPAPVCSDPMVRRLVEEAVQDLAAQGQLPYYAAIAHLPGYVSTLRRRIAELEQARVPPATVSGIGRESGPALVELAKVFTSYQARLQGVGWIDAEGLSQLALEALELDSRLAGEIRLLAVDGFDSFNKAQLATLKRLGETVPEVLITLPGETSLQRPAFQRFLRSLGRLQAAFPDAHLEGRDLRARLPRSLSHLESGLFQPGVLAEESDGSVAFVEARTPVDEAREALRWIKALIVRDHLRPEDCALITPDPERYRAALLEVGEEFGLPLRFSEGDRLASAPGIAALLDLLEMPL